MAEGNLVNKCQYWSVNEPLPCVYWDSSNIMCGYTLSSDTASDAQFAPYCNLLGTSVACLQYKSSSPGTTKSICILPDPRRHGCNRVTGVKWVTAGGLAEEDPEDTGTETAYDIFDWQFDSINGYNAGACDGYGTDTTCSGYAPHHLGFGVIQPSKTYTTSDPSKETIYLTAEELGYRLPTHFVIYNIRAVLSKCYWWKEDPGVFVVDTSTGKIELDTVWACSCTVDTSKFSEFTLENGPPCNGAKSECPNYTGVCWQYCTDKLMESGDPVLAEQIHELRYYHKESNWTVEHISSSFIDEGNIYAWKGTRSTTDNYSTLKGDITVTLSDGSIIEDYRIPAVKVSMSTFEKFTIDTTNTIFTAGTEVTGKIEDYPSLIMELQELPLSPIIKTQFAKIGNQLFFDTKHLVQDTNVLIYGKTFYNQPTFALNITDKEIQQFIPSEIFQYNTIYDIERAYEPLDFVEFSVRLATTLKLIANLFPDKIKSNSVPSDELVFVNTVPVLFKKDINDGTNANTILVWQQVGDYITYDKITFSKRLVGGILSQTSFSVTGDDKTIDIPRDFEAGFRCDMNSNGSLEFDYIPFVSEMIASELLYVYNASTILEPMGNNTLVGHLDYKLVAEEYIVFEENVHIIGSNGYVLIDLDHDYLNSILKPWEVEKILLVLPDEDDSETGDSVSTECEMEVVFHGSSELLGSQQLLVKPKNMEDWHSACSGAFAKLTNVAYWEKRSDGELPEEGTFSIEIDEDAEPVNESLTPGTLTTSDDGFTYTDYEFTFTPTAVISNCQGKPFTSYKTKPIGMVKQIFCPAVEIWYAWSAQYLFAWNSPSCFCSAETPWTMPGPKVTSNARLPSCVDHPESPTQSNGAIWWPFNSCTSWEAYEEVTNLNNYSVDVMGPFQLKSGEGDDAEWLHGNHDMRMLGPHTYFGHVGIGCNPLLACSCLMRTMNSVKSSEDMFIGRGSIRGKVDEDIWRSWEQFGGKAPKFGNVTRPILRTYRTLDQVPYLSSSLAGSMGKWKLMPAAMVFSKVDITSQGDSMFNYFCSEEGPEVINPLGFLTATSFDGVTVGETVDYVNRFRHDEVFRCQISFDLAYPKASTTYTRTFKNSIVTPSYMYKAYSPPTTEIEEVPEGSEESSLFIQWAWQEPWKELERSTLEDYEQFDQLLKTGITTGTFGDVKGGITSEGGTLTGKLGVITVNYPTYYYNYILEEFRLMPDEGTHIIKITVPEKSEYTGEYVGFMTLQLNNGPIRGLNWDGNWLSEEDCEKADVDPDEFNVSLYDECIGVESKEYESTFVEKVWVDDVTLFTTGYEDDSKLNAELAGRMIKTFYNGPNDAQMTLKTHFQRGLTVTPTFGATTAVPVRVVPISQLTATEVPIEFICGTTESNDLIFSFDNVKRSIGRFSITYRIGSEIVVEATNETEAVYKFYHTPAVSLETSSSTLYDSESMTVSTEKSASYDVETKTFEWLNPLSFIASGEVGAKLVVRITPTTTEIESAGTNVTEYYKSLNVVYIENVVLYEDVLVSATETLKLWERKYYVSYGESGDSPPQGTDDLGIVLGSTFEASTHWQKDDTTGVQGVPNSTGDMKFMSKTRGRIVGDMIAENEVGLEFEILSGEVASMEDKQKNMYDEMVNKVDSSSYMVSTMPPGLNNLLNDANVTFAGPSGLQLTNTLMMPLAGVNHFPNYSAEGHQYQPGSPSPQIECPNHFLYKYQSMDKIKWGDEIEDSVTIAMDGTIQYGVEHEMTHVFTQFTYGTVMAISRMDAQMELMESNFPEKYARNTYPRIFSTDTTELLFPTLEPNPQ